MRDKFNKIRYIGNNNSVIFRYENAKNEVLIQNNPPK